MCEERGSRRGGKWNIYFVRVLVRVAVEFPSKNTIERATLSGINTSNSWADYYPG